jgi:D12 class N6 adenine-specific DNA methyltransferase
MRRGNKSPPTIRIRPSSRTRMSGARGSAPSKSHVPSVKNVQIESADWRDVMSRYDRPETLFYCDPPYVPQTRVAGTYSHELTQNDHRGLVAYLLVLSGYCHQTYSPLERAGSNESITPHALMSVGRLLARWNACGCLHPLHAKSKIGTSFRRQGRR